MLVIKLRSSAVKIEKEKAGSVPYIQRFQNSRWFVIITGLDPRSYPESSDSGSVSRAVGNASRSACAMSVRINPCRPSTSITHAASDKARGVDQVDRLALLFHISVAVLCWAVVLLLLEGR